MEWARWEPLYREILADFGYPRESDEAARDELDLLLRDKRPADLGALRAATLGSAVVIAGPHSTAARALEGPVFATDAASWAFPLATVIVTDLDGDVDAQRAANARGVPLFVHAHGDNKGTILRVVPKLTGPLQGTTQAEPRPPRVANYGGFTDGDRAACLAAHLGARSLLLAGFDFDAPVAKAGRDPSVKARKLAWARSIIAKLGLPTKVV